MENKGKDIKQKANRLIHEKSPYLLQHAYNPVDWYPWGSDAFEKAKREDKPIFLSSGYSTCHWCHVMEKESYEDEEVAHLMNEIFVNIKIDREERPDIDSIYMKVCQAMTGSGGWPLNIIMTPDKKPFFAATYIPKEGRFGQKGMLELIPEIMEAWKNSRGKAEAIGTQIISSIILSAGKEQDAKDELNEDVIHEAYEQLFALFDENNGGFGGAPKFPTPHNLMFLLRYWKRTGDKMALHMVERTLFAMSMGGIYDHTGFGFHRYSTDSQWFMPHFEKMLYDQALMAMVYTEAYQATGNPEFKRIACEIFTYVLRDMTSPEGGFYSGEDADSESVEGKFYVWTEDEINSVLGEKSQWIKKVFNIKSYGNYKDVGNSEKNVNILHRSKIISELSSELKISEEMMRKRIEEALKKLFIAREKRIHPGKDDKILTDWNGLMIAAFAKGAQAFDRPEYADAARKAADFILKHMQDQDHRLYHRYREGDRAVKAFLDDYAFFAWGLIELYEATFDVSYLKTALKITDTMIGHFWDKEKYGFYFIADNAEQLIIRNKEIYDGAVPSGNSVAMLNLLRLGRITGMDGLENKAAKIGVAFSTLIKQAPSAYTYMMMALDFALGPTCELVIAGDEEAEDTKAMLAVLGMEFFPYIAVVFRPCHDSEITAIAEYTKDLKCIENRATAYVCRNHGCQLPVTDPVEMMNILKDIKGTKHE